jgi:predicted Zn-dependent protease
VAGPIFISGSAIIVSSQSFKSSRGAGFGFLAGLLALAALGAGGLFGGAHAQSGQPQFQFLRDAETETYLRHLVDPIFTAAGLDVSAVHLYLINDASINAFVAEGQNLFMQTGTITSAETPNQLLGVMAHETGHMAGGHITRTAEAAGQFTRPMLIGMLLGIGAMVAGAPQAGAAILTGSQTIAQRAYLAYTRVQEASADAAAVRFLTATHQSGQGLLEFFQKMSNEEILSARKIDPYAVSHPLSSERISSLQQEVDASPYVNVKDPQADIDELKLIQGKIYGFLETPNIVLRRYPLRDTSAQARYARAAAYYRQGQLDEGLKEVNSLLKDAPKNPYFHELKGQMLFESGKVVESITPYRTAIGLLPHDGIIHTSFGQALIAAAEAEHDPRLLDEAIPVLRTAIKEDQELPLAWRFLAEAYAAKSDEGMAELSTAELHYSMGDLLEAGRFAMRARDKLDKSTVSYNRAIDIIHLAQEAKPQKVQRQQ